MALSLLFAAAPRAVASFRASSASSPALDSGRRPQNVPGDFFVDHRCIDCQTCRWMAPEVFKRVDGKAAVAAHPISDDHRTKALQGVYHCGYHSEDSFGATSYLITHPDGNILVDSPRYTTKLANNIEELGGARYMFLTHRDDVADHRKWAERLKCERIIHSGDVERATVDVERKLTGNGPWNIGADFELIHTPGHTQGSVCLFYKPVKALFTGDHVAKSEESDDLYLFLMYSRQPVSLQLDSMRKLLKLDFEWFLPGHGYRIHYKDVHAKDSAIESLIAITTQARGIL
uniref:Metallo-beta-lactamase domain-containing protein n=1 Tax=Oryza rufipogon TaxID=4529 RepID=A0A0E0NN95_ORYRU